jgi:hypothetical protein
MNDFLKTIKVALKKTSLSLSDLHRAATAEAGSFSVSHVNALDYHNRMAEWIGSSRKVHAAPGAPFGKPTDATSKAVYWQHKSNPAWMADTRPKRKSLDPTKAGTPPNPGRPELGGALKDAR